VSGVDAVIASAAVVLSLPLPFSVGCTYDTKACRDAGRFFWQKPVTAPSGEMAHGKDLSRRFMFGQDLLARIPVLTQR